MTTTIKIHHGALCDEYEEQLNAQGFTYGDNAELIQELGNCITMLRVHDLLTDSAWDKILQRFQKKYLVNKKYLKRLGGDADDGTDEHL